MALVGLGVMHATNNYKAMGRLLCWRHVETWGEDIAEGTGTVPSAWGGQGGFRKEERLELTPD